MEPFMKQTNVSPQYQRTHKAICQAFISLLKDTSFEQITVQNILEKTPVTRTTFYKHFSDKYALAEYLQNEYLSMVKEVRNEMEGKDLTEYTTIARKYAAHYSELYEALSKIRTETINLREGLKINLVNKYLAEHEISTNLEDYESNRLIHAIASQIYAEALVTFETSSIEKAIVSKDSRAIYNHSMIDAFLALLELSDDAYLRDYLLKKVDHKL